MKKENVIQQIVDKKNDIDVLVHQKYHELAQNGGLSIEQYHLLLELDDLTRDNQEICDAPTIGNMARNINQSQNTVSEKITRLENKGLLLRVKDPKDKRISRVILSDSGRALLDSIDVQANSKFLVNALSVMETEDANELLRLLNILEGHMKTTK